MDKYTYIQYIYIRRKWDSEGAEESRQDYWEAGYTAKREIANAPLPLKQGSQT